MVLSRRQLLLPLTLMLLKRFQPLVMTAGHQVFCLPVAPSPCCVDAGLSSIKKLSSLPSSLLPFSPSPPASSHPTFIHHSIQFLLLFKSYIYPITCLLQKMYIFIADNTDKQKKNIQFPKATWGSSASSVCVCVCVCVCV